MPAATKDAKKVVQTPGVFLCEFCKTGHHRLCPEMIRNGSAVEHPTLTCTCFTAGHTQGRQPPLHMEIIRMSDATLAVLAEIRAAKAAKAVAAAPASARASSNGTGAAAGAVGGPAEGLHTHCERCGWDFGQAIPQARCGSAKMCDKRVEKGDPTFGRRKAKP